MSYNYYTQKVNIFTEKGQVMFLSVRDNAKKMIDKSGAFKMEKIFSCASGDVWNMMACVDRLVELKELKEITGSDVRGQDRVFVAASRDI